MEDSQLQGTVEKKPKPKRRKMVGVYVVSKKGGSALVQWGPPEDRHRGYVPTEEVEGGKVAKTVLGAAIPYGLPWEELVDLSGLTPEKFAQELRRADVWTLEDLGTKFKQAKRALTAANPVSVSMLRKAAEKLEKEA